MKRLAMALLVLLYLTSGAAADPHPELQLDEIYYVMIEPNVKVTTVWKECGQVNAFYSHRTKTVILCEELLPLGKHIIQYIYAHEIAHAVIMQLDLPYTGSHETAADELAAVMLLLYNYDDAVWDSANWWYSRGEDMPPWEDHADDQERGWRMACLKWGRDNEDARCRARWKHAFVSWMRLLRYR